MPPRLATSVDFLTLGRYLPFLRKCCRDMRFFSCRSIIHTKNGNQKAKTLKMTMTVKRTLSPAMGSNEGSIERSIKQRLSGSQLVFKPSDYAIAAFKANGTLLDETKQALRFQPPTEEMIDAYNNEILKSVRNNDIAKVRQMHADGKLKVNCCNKFGESILHLACRRSYTDMVEFLIRDAKLEMNIRDDYKRTILHDALWTPEPNFELVDMLIREVPEYLLMEDVRGCTPLDYARREHWGKWLRFLWERRDILRPLEKEL